MLIYSIRNYCDSFNSHVCQNSSIMKGISNQIVAVDTTSG